MDALWILVGLIAGVAITFIALWPVISKAQVSEKRRLELEIHAAGLTKTIEERENALAEERRLLDEKIKILFADLSASALRKNSEAFLETAKMVLALQHQESDAELEKRKTAIENLVKPIQDGIMAVSAAATAMEKDRVKAFGTIEEQLKKSAEEVAEVARQAGGLKDALKKPNVRGRWGEVQLRNCIELAGMEDHCDVEFQETNLSPEEELVRPDMLVRMPGGRKIAVDAKTPMEHFLSYTEAATDDDRNAALIKHGRAVKTHVSRLANREYMQKIAESPDFVVMFLPNESFLGMALEREPELIEEALSKKVLITTPGTLIGLLKVVRYGWNEQKIALNAQQIADEGAKLNTQISRFLDDYAKLGKALKSATEAYESTTHRVEKQILNSSVRLTTLGAKSRKALSAAAVQMLGSGEDSQEDGDQDEQAINGELVPSDSNVQHQLASVSEEA